jgi:HEXXH motif-containing protein
LNARFVTVGHEPWMLEIDGAPLDLPPDRGGFLSSRLATPSDDIIAELKERGLQVIVPAAVTRIGTILDQATKLIRVAPGLDSVVRRCVKEIVILRVPDDSFDVSHSEPRWATRIFVSVPCSSVVGDLRVAEAVVHEAMHLNLTFLEGCTRLVARAELLFSPWKTDARPASGVLHGVYVFACIYRFFGHVSREVRLDERSQRHVEQRFAEIRGEVGAIDRHSLLECLTATGASLANTFFGAIDG